MKFRSMRSFVELNTEMRVLLQVQGAIVRRSMRTVWTQIDITSASIGRRSRVYAWSLQVPGSAQEKVSLTESQQVDAAFMSAGPRNQGEKPSNSTMYCPWRSVVPCVSS